MPSLFPNQDKVMHIAEYAPFGWLTVKAFMPATAIGFTASLVFSMAYAATDEIHQAFVPGREASLMDWIADDVGISVSFFIYYYKSFKRTI